MEACGLAKANHGRRLKEDAVPTLFVHTKPSHPPLPRWRAVKRRRAQVLTLVIMRMLLPLLAKSSVSLGGSHSCFDDVITWDIGTNRDSIRLAMPPVKEWILDEMPLALLPSSTTIQLPIKEERLPLAHGGLGGIATMRSTNPLLFFMQCRKCGPSCKATTSLRGSDEQTASCASAMAEHKCDFAVKTHYIGHRTRAAQTCPKNPSVGIQASPVFVKDSSVQTDATVL
ncbi:uncharacterized protein LOC119439914 [Dermacentor silvarum]|uniref:uncharacterized protein LOC119439914 n=1 Tax=Dermacentor silvarum TaxID=543639 RepID=UPI002100E804|nr:uncharacterized protein LOC119439914 [Dermacentor silvarum]XP_049516244.1 uncharacterized protein LOC119439914 [Dermacentor silvarum]